MRSWPATRAWRWSATVCWATPRTPRWLPYASPTPSAASAFRVCYETCVRADCCPQLGCTRPTVAVGLCW